MPQEIKLEKPLVFYDIEATGIDTKLERIVEISFLKRNPDGTEEIRTDLINPGIPIPPESIAIHGITDEKVSGCPRFEQLAPDYIKFLEGCDLGGFNILMFDVPMLVNEFARAGIGFSLEGRSLIDSMKIFHFKEPRDLTAAYKYYCGQELVGAHGAEADIKATFEVFKSQMEKYDDLPREMGELSKFCNPHQERFVDKHRRFYWRNHEAHFNFGKNKGKSLRELAATQKDYIHWMLNGNFEPEVKDILSAALNGKFPAKK